MKGLVRYYQWSIPLLGLLTAHHWFLGHIEHPTWWLLIATTTLAGVVRR